MEIKILFKYRFSKKRIFKSKITASLSAKDIQNELIWKQWRQKSGFWRVRRLLRTLRICDTCTCVHIESLLKVKPQTKVSTYSFISTLVSLSAWKKGKKMLERISSELSLQTHYIDLSWRKTCDKRHQHGFFNWTGLNVRILWTGHHILLQVTMQRIDRNLFSG